MIFITIIITKTFYLEGNSCNLDGGRRGVCKNLKDCPLKLSETVEGRRNHLSNDRSLSSLTGYLKTGKN